jgi:hypothetical protein
MLELRLRYPEALIQGALLTDEQLADAIIEVWRAEVLRAVKEVRGRV